MKWGLLIFRIFATAISLFGVLYRIFSAFLNGEGLIRSLDMLGYFTIQSGLIVLFVFSSLLINQLRGTPEKAISPQFRGAALLYIMITSIIFMGFLNNMMDESGLSRLILYINHLGTAILLLIDNVISIQPKSYRWSLIPKWLIFPFAYLIFSIIEGFFFNRFRYYFLNYNELGIINYLLFIFMLVAVFCLLAAIIIFFNRLHRVKE